MIQKLNHGFVVGGRLVANIDESKQPANFCEHEKVVKRFRPLGFFGFAYFRVAVTGQVGKDKLAEVKVIDEPRSPRGSGSAGKFFLPRKHVYERGLADVRLAGNGNHGLFGV